MKSKSLPPLAQKNEFPKQNGEDACFVLNALTKPVFVVGRDNEFTYVNSAAEQFFKLSAGQLLGRALHQFVPADSPVFSLISSVREKEHPIREYALRIETPRIDVQNLTVEANPLAEKPGSVVVSFQEDSIARKLDHQLIHRNAARSVTAMAAMLAHEVKNPLSGIKGAAQLLEQGAADGERALTRLICDEADRIVALVNRVEMFSDDRPIERAPVNIHEVLHHVTTLAAAGFARGVTIKEIYDPSLPPVFGNRDLLIQVFLNLLKNAAEALPSEGGEIVLETRYQQGVRLTLAGGGASVDLPIVVSVQDNGSGIPEELRRHLFDPFVTTKAGGKGLGLALVAKIISDHGGAIELEGTQRRTSFRISLPKSLTQESMTQESMAKKSASKVGEELSR
jgi:two-component system nitrogen regulation sensor histidine kinase GlnL